MRQMKRVGL